MKVLLTIAGIGPEYGGPSHTVPALARNLADLGLDVELICCESPKSTSLGAPASLPARSSGLKLAGRDAGAPRPTDTLRLHVLPYHNRTTRWLPRSNDFSKVLEAVSNGRGGSPTSDLRPPTSGPGS